MLSSPPIQKWGNGLQDQFPNTNIYIWTAILWICAQTQFWKFKSMVR